MSKKGNNVTKISKEMLSEMAQKQDPSSSLSDGMDISDDSLKFDLGIMSVFSSGEVSARDHNGDINAFIAENGTQMVQQLVNKLFSCPSEPVEVGRLAVLPSQEFRLPREKPIPAAKVETTWEKFAKTKGIVKKKKSRMEFDEEKKEMVPRWGYKSGNDTRDDWVIEQKANDEDTTDPWKKLKDEKKERVAKNKKQQLKNIQKASGDRVLPGSLDLSSVSGSVTGKRNQQGKLKEKTHGDIALEVAQKSTNSMGKFDKLRKGERPVTPNKKPRKDNILQNASEEKKQSISVLAKVLGKQEEQDKVFLNKAISDLGLNNLAKGELKGKGVHKDSKKGDKGKGSKKGSFKGKGGFKARSAK